MTSLSLRGVSKTYGDVPALDDVDLVVDRGRIVTVLGPSGCGKSTLLRLVAGLERPDTGSIEVDDVEMSGGRRFVPPERRRVAMVFQDHGLFPHLDVRRNVAFGLRGVPRADRRSRVEEMLELVDLGRLAHRRPHELSGGEQQRVALARALAPRPAVVLLDEPFSSLDENLRVQVRRETSSVLREAAASAILVTHDQTEALSLGDQVAIILQGRVRQVGAPQDLYRRPTDRDVATFLGDVDVLPGRREADVVHTEIGTVALEPGSPETADVDVLLRSHEVLLQPDGPDTVVDVEFHGSTYLLTVELRSGRRLRARRSSDLDLGVGRAVRVVVDPAARPAVLDAGPR